MPGGLAVAVVAVLLLLAYVVPYTILADAGGWALYAYWAALGAAAAVLAWAGTRGWDRGV